MYGSIFIKKNKNTTKPLYPIWHGNAGPAPWMLVFAVSSGEQRAPQHPQDTLPPLVGATVCLCSQASHRSSAATWPGKEDELHVHCPRWSFPPWDTHLFFKKHWSWKQVTKNTFDISCKKTHKTQNIWLEVSCTGNTRNWNAGMALVPPPIPVFKLSAKSRWKG